MSAARARPSRPLRLGLCGHGWVIERCYAPLLRRPGAGFSVAAVCDPVAAARGAARQAWPGALVTEDVGAFLAAGLDAVLIASPNPAHLDQAAAVLRAGLPCLVEKPLLRDLGDLALLEAAARPAALLVPAVACRRRPDTQAWLAAAREMGPLRRLSLSWQRHRGVPGAAWHHRAADGWTGVFADLGSHLVDIAGAALGWTVDGLERGEIRRRKRGVGASAGWYGVAADLAIDTEDALAVRFRVGTAEVAIDVAWTGSVPGDLVRLTADGDGGSAVLEGLFGFSRERRVPHQRLSVDAAGVRRESHFEPGPALQVEGFDAVLADFAAAIEAGRGTRWPEIRFAAAIGSCFDLRRP